VVEYLPSIGEVLGLFPSTGKKQIKNKKFTPQLNPRPDELSPRAARTFHVNRHTK
jgi:hypothetical protein